MEEDILNYSSTVIRHPVPNSKNKNTVMHELWRRDLKSSIYLYN